MLKRGLDRKGQLTIFIILGMVIFFVFIFMLKVDNQIMKKQLEQGEEDVYSKLFSKEALRLFVEDCLHDDLQDALVTIGRQGRIWSDQPGGRVAFLEGVNGVTIGGERIAYALRKTNYDDSAAYPCDPFDTGVAPSYCKYPQKDGYFGETAITESDIEDDLESALKVKVQTCLNDYLHERVAGAVFEESDFLLDIDLKQEGIAVEATYPLGFTVGEEDFFHISIFEFFYPTQLRKLVDYALEFPLRADRQHVDFSFSNDFWASGSTTVGGDSLDLPLEECNSLGLHLERGFADEERLLPNGDTLYTFTSPPPNIVDTATDYTFQYVRQNRPPALDYISRVDCPSEEYNYLVVKGDSADDGAGTNSYGDIDIVLQAKDPDDDLISDGVSTEDDVKYYFSGDTSAFGNHFFNEDDSDGTVEIDGRIKAKKLVLNKDEVNDLPFESGETFKIYTLTAIAKDSYGLEDSQEIKIKVSNEINPNSAVLEIEYPFVLEEAFQNWISKEDPFVVKVSGGDDSDVVLEKFSVGEEEFDFPSSGCFNFPNDDDSCELDTYDDIVTGFTAASGSLYEKIISDTTTSLNAELTLNNCPLTPEGVPPTTVKTLDVVVKDCVPYNDDEADDLIFVSGDLTGFSMTAGLYTKNPAGKWEADITTNPFLADHVCCDDNGDYKLGTECFNAETCTAANLYHVQTIKKTCANNRGNICSGALVTPTPAIITPPKCGFPGKMGCSSDINIKCQDKPVFALIQTAGSVAGGWCGGTNGCGETPRGGETGWCPNNGNNEIVAKNIGDGVSFSTDLSSNKYLVNGYIKYKCGCATNGEDTGKKCDHDFDGTDESYTCKANGACSLP
ncbi:hypothetical protein HYU21_02045 [Candidatus Woesearchaeota archaeon]|nr:hypothetical protein [Candidatus Woesearchaeota archaeon]